MTQVSSMGNGDVIAFMDETDVHDDPSEAEPLNVLSTKNVTKRGLSLARYKNPQRLIETDNTNNPKPTSGPEIDDLEPEGKDAAESGDDKGIDDGFLEKPFPSFPPRAPNYPGGGYPPFPAPPNVPTDGFPMPPVIPDVNVYQQKKILAQGMMDLALISANANQFRYVLQSNSRHPFYYPSLIMIGLSLFLQIVVGIGLIWNSRYNVKNDSEMCKANKMNNWTIIGVFLITIINVFISSFGVVETQERTFYHPSALR